MRGTDDCNSFLFTFFFVRRLGTTAQCQLSWQKQYYDSLQNVLKTLVNEWQKNGGMTLVHVENYCILVEDQQTSVNQPKMYFILVFQSSKQSNCL